MKKNLNNDKPIETIENDLLDRADFSKNLANVILNYNDSNSLVIGLAGGWGTGKTSIINMAVEVLKNKNQHDFNKPIIIKYNPWIYSNQENMIYAFFNLLHIEINKLPNTEIIKEISIALLSIGKCLKVIPNVGPGIDIACDIIKSMINKTDAEKDKTLSEFDIHYFKIKLDKYFSKLDTKLLIIIDDIDRLSDQEICQIFQLVKKLADFPNTIYLMAFDQEVVTKALNRVQKDRGEQYIEKIIQLLIDVPHISEYNLNEILLSELEVITKECKNEDLLDIDRFRKMYYRGFNKLIKNIRDINRYLNYLHATFSIVKDEINAADYFIISGFRLFLPELYNEIFDNKELFSYQILDNPYLYLQYKDNIIDKRKEQLSNILKKIFKNNVSIQKYIDDILYELFPRIGELLSSGHSSYNSQSWDKKWKSDGRICSKDNFDHFFKLSLDKNKVSRLKTIGILESSKCFDSLESSILNLIDSNAVSHFLYNINDYNLFNKIELTNEMIENILKVIFVHGSSFPKGRVSEMIPFIVKDFLLLCLKQIQDKNDRYNILLNTVNYSISQNKMNTICQLIYEPREDFNAKVEIDCQEIIDIILMQIRKLIDNEDIANEEYDAYLWFFLNKYEQDKDIMSKLKSKIENNDLFFINMLIKTVGDAESSSVDSVICRKEKRMNFDKEMFGDIDESIKRAEKIKNSDLFNTLNEAQKEAVELLLKAMNIDPIDQINSFDWQGLAD